MARHTPGRCFFADAFAHLTRTPSQPTCRWMYHRIVMVDEPSSHDEAFWGRYFRRGSAVCPHCRYNMHGNKTPVCPECGKISTLAELRHAEDPSVESWYTSGAWAIMAACLLGLVPGFIGLSLGVLTLSGMMPGTHALKADAAVLVVAGLFAVIVLPTSAWAWKRGVRTVSRWPMLLRWAIVGVFVLFAMIGAMALLASIALVGLVR